MGFTKVLSKIILLIVGLLPFIVSIYVYLVAGSGTYISDPISLILGWIALISIPTLIVIYIYNVFHNDGIASNQKMLWALIIFFGNVIAFPFYWYLHVWRGLKGNTRIRT